MHTARWDHAQDLTGKRVAIIGTGASAVQVIPVDRAKRRAAHGISADADLVLPQSRCAAASCCKPGHAVPGGKTLQRLLSQAYVEVTFTFRRQYYTLNPFGKRDGRIGKAYLRKQVDDPTVRDKLTPRYAAGCKRPGFHNAYLSTFNRDNVRSGDRADRQGHRVRRGDHRR